MLVFVTVNAGDYLGRGKEYVEILFDSVKRNLKEGTEGRFVCFTDDPEPYADGIEKRALHGGLRGWWNKIYLFQKGHFEDGDRIVYLDLDTVIVSGLDEIIKYNGPFAILRDFYRYGGLQSSVMMWEANNTPPIWEDYIEAEKPDINGGDQAWLERYPWCFSDRLQDVYPNCFVSYKVSCITGIPKNAKIVVFHGNPRPHNAGGWVDKVWKIGGGNALELEMVGSVPAEKLEANVRHCLTLNLPHIEKLSDPLKNPNAVMVGGGPSLAACLSEIRIRQAHGEKVFALNGSYRYLENNGILADYQVIADPRPENAQFIPEETNAVLLLSSTCDPAVFEKAKGKKVIVWHVGHDGMDKIVDPDQTKYVAYIAGGSTVGMVGMSIAYAIGYRKLHLFGYDSSYQQDEGHAYPQSLNAGERVLDIDAYGREFKSSPWMVAQANEFVELAPALIELGCEITTHGDGLLQHMASAMSEACLPETDITQIDGFWWPKNDIECRASIEAFSGDVNSIMAHCARFGVAIQAGGNVGVWPKMLAHRFGAVYTFEPDSANFQCLVRNVTELNVTKLQAILGAEAGLVKLATTRHNCGAHFVDGNGTIPTLRIDDLGLEACDLIQLDVEGFEAFALKGALKTIEKFKPVIVCEEKGLGEKFGIGESVIGEMLSSFGYSVIERINRDVIYTCKESY